MLASARTDEQVGCHTRLPVRKHTAPCPNRNRVSAADFAAAVAAFAAAAMNNALPDGVYHQFVHAADLDLGDEEARPMNVELIRRYNNLTMSVNGYNDCTRPEMNLPNYKELRIRRLTRIFKKDVSVHHKSVLTQMIKMFNQGIVPVALPSAVELRACDVLAKPQLFSEVCHYMGGAAHVAAAIDARAARMAAEAAAAQAVAEAAAAQAAPGRRGRHCNQVEEDSAGAGPSADFSD